MFTRLTAVIAHICQCTPARHKQEAVAVALRAKKLAIFEWGKHCTNTHEQDTTPFMPAPP